MKRKYNNKLKKKVMTLDDEDSCSKDTCCEMLVCIV